MVDYPVYYKNSIKYRTRPENLKEIALKYYPLTKEFIDWVAEQGFKISYFADWKEGTGAVIWGPRRIFVSSQGEQKVIDKVLVHELVHITIPGVPAPHEHLRTTEKFEEAIDEIADIYLENQELVEYTKKTIPLYKSV